MQKYFDSITGANGVAATGAAVTVLNYGTTTPASIFSDASGLFAKTNPIAADETGYFDFYAADGRYSLIISAAGFATKTLTDIQLEDTKDGMAVYAASSGSSLVGHIPDGTGSVATTVQHKLREISTTADYDSADSVLLNAPGLSGGGFWEDGSVKGRIFRLADRVFIGDAATESTGKTTPSGIAKSWVGNADNGYMTYFETRSTLSSFSQIGGVSISGASRSSDNHRNGELSTIGIAGYVRNDNTNLLDKKSAWAIYGHAAQITANKSTFGLELDVCSTQTLVEADPYLMGATGITAAAWIGVGGETAQGMQSNGSGSSLTNVSCAIAIINSESSAAGNRYSKGIVFHALSLNGCDGVTGSAEAISFAKGHTISWKYDNNSNGASIVSNVNSVLGKQGIVFENNQTKFLSADKQIGSFEDATSGFAANYARLLSFGTGSSPQIRAGGESNLDLIIQGKGSGGGVLRDGNSSSRVATNTTGIGFNGTTPRAAPAITGSRGGNAALASLLTELASYGLILNSTTA